tara:strand:+ start:1072 stop:1611 length:540 start_codon:yes stop_codon:yes gene_type:complete
MTKKTDWLVVGEITAPHGIDGKLRVKSLSDFEERFLNPGSRWLQKEKEEPVKFELISGFKKPGKSIYIITFAGVENRDKAERLKKQKILVRNTDIPQLKEGEFHINELLRLKVKLCCNNKMDIVGEVCDLINDSNNLLMINMYKTNKKVLIPFVKEIVPTINKEEKYIIINPPKGLLDL